MGFRNGFVSPMAPELKARIDQVVNDMKLSDKYRAYLDSFYVPGFDPMHMGSFKLRSGAYIGIPRNFLYKSKRDIERDLILVRSKESSHVEGLCKMFWVLDGKTACAMGK